MIKEHRIVTLGFGLCFALALFAASNAQQISGGGGGGTPGGSTTQLQYNNAGVFGGAAGTIWDGNDLTLPRNLLLTSTPAQIIGASGSNVTIGAINGIAYLGNTSNFGASVKTGDTGAQLRSDGLFSWSSDTTSFGTSDIALSRNAAGVAEINNGTPGTYREAKLRSVVVGGTVPGISGCSAGTQTGGGTAGTYSSGTTGACTVILTFAFTAPTGWNCSTNNRTTAADPQRQSASSQTTATITGTTVSGDVISFHCVAY